MLSVVMLVVALSYRYADGEWSILTMPARRGCTERSASVRLPGTSYGPTRMSFQSNSISCLYWMGDKL